MLVGQWQLCYSTCTCCYSKADVSILIRTYYIIFSVHRLRQDSHNYSSDHKLCTVPAPGGLQLVAEAEIGHLLSMRSIASSMTPAVSLAGRGFNNDRCIFCTQLMWASFHKGILRKQGCRLQFKHPEISKNCPDIVRNCIILIGQTARQKSFWYHS
jgi:hypothetical protein